MNPEFFKARLRAVIPEEGLPDDFAVITACNPNSEIISDAENAARTEAFREELLEKGLSHFPVTGYDPDSNHEEPGFGVVCDLPQAVELGRRWGQVAIFWVEKTEVFLISCDIPEEKYARGPWAEVAG